MIRLKERTSSMVAMAAAKLEALRLWAEDEFSEVNTTIQSLIGIISDLNNTKYNKTGGVIDGDVKIHKTVPHGIGATLDIRNDTYSDADGASAELNIGVGNSRERQAFIRGVGYNPYGDTHRIAIGVRTRSSDSPETLVIDKDGEVTTNGTKVINGKLVIRGVAEARIIQGGYTDALGTELHNYDVGIESRHPSTAGSTNITQIWHYNGGTSIYYSGIKLLDLRDLYTFTYRGHNVFHEGNLNISNYLKRDGSLHMTGDLQIGDNNHTDRIIKLREGQFGVSIGYSSSESNLLLQAGNQKGISMWVDGDGGFGVGIKALEIEDPTGDVIFYNKIIKDGSSNSEILLGGGGTYTLADLATVVYVQQKLAELIDSSPETLDTLNELAAALGDDPNFATTVSNQIGTKANKSIIITAGTGLNGGGNLESNRNISLDVNYTDSRYRKLLQNVGTIDANTLINEGVYHIGSSSTNIPSGSAMAGFIIVENVSDLFIHQLYKRSRGETIAFRVSEDGGSTWSDWQSLWHSGNFDPDNKSNTGHEHDASAIVSGTIPYSRLPNTITHSSVSDWIEMAGYGNHAEAGYLTEHQSISHLETKEDANSVMHKSIVHINEAALGDYTPLDDDYTIIDHAVGTEPHNLNLGSIEKLIKGRMFRIVCGVKFLYPDVEIINMAGQDKNSSVPFDVGATVIQWDGEDWYVVG